MGGNSISKTMVGLFFTKLRQFKLSTIFSLSRLMPTRLTARNDDMKNLTVVTVRSGDENMFEIILHR